MNTDNELSTLDGLIRRLTELREMAGQDCSVVCGKSFDSTKEQLTITMVSLDSCPQAKTKQVAILVEPKRSVEEQNSAFLDWQEKQFRRAFTGEQETNKETEEQPEYSVIETIYRCGKKPHWNVGDTLAYYEFTSDCEGEIVLGKVTNVELDEEYNDWLYTFEDGSQYDEESLLSDQTYKKNCIK